MARSIIVSLYFYISAPKVESLWRHREGHLFPTRRRRWACIGQMEKAVRASCDFCCASEFCQTFESICEQSEFLNFDSDIFCWSNDNIISSSNTRCSANFDSDFFCWSNANVISSSNTRCLANAENPADCSLPGSFHCDILPPLVCY